MDAYEMTHISRGHLSYLKVTQAEIELDLILDYKASRSYQILQICRVVFIKGRDVWAKTMQSWIRLSQRLLSN